MRKKKLVKSIIKICIIKLEEMIKPSKLSVKLNILQSNSK